MSYAAVLENKQQSRTQQETWQFVVPFPYGFWQATASAKGLQRLDWIESPENTTESVEPLPEKIASWQKQLAAYLQGENTAIDRLPIDWEALSGTDFQKRCWLALLTIPRGETRSYGWVAEQAGSPLAVRATGQANGSNQLPLVIPCHRVIAANGKLTGFMRGRDGGLRIKEWLLNMEKQA